MLSLRQFGLVAAVLVLIALQPAPLHAQGCQGGSCPAPWASRPSILSPSLPGSFSRQAPLPPALDPEGRPYANRPSSDPQPGEPWFAAVCRVTGSEGRGVSSVGSGVLVNWNGRRLVLTAYHVIQGTTDRVVRFAGGASARLVRARGDATWDYGFGELENEAGTLPCAVDLDDGDKRLPDGEPLVSCGLGGDGRLAINRGRFLRYSAANGQTEGNWLVLSGQARSGDSGGPIFRRGKVAGVLWGTDRAEVVGTQIGLIHWPLTSLYPPPRPPERSPIVTPSPRHLVTPSTPPGGQCSPAGSADPSCLELLRRMKRKPAPVTTLPPTAPPTAAPPVAVQVETPRPPAIAPKEPEPEAPDWLPKLIGVGLFLAWGAIVGAFVFFRTRQHTGWSS